MNSNPASKLNSIAPVILLVLMWVVWTAYHTNERRMQNARQEWFESQRPAWAREDAGRALADRQKVHDVEKRYRQELLNSWGGPIDAALKDPALDIRQMLLQITRSCAPTGAVVVVQADRFTEFSVAITLAAPLPMEGMAAISQIVLTHGTPFVHDVRFIQGENLLAELDWSAIESVPDWGGTTLGAVKQLMLNAALQNSPAPPVAATKPSSENPVPADEMESQKKYRAGLAAYDQLYKDHVKVVANMVSNLNSAYVLSIFKSRADMDAQITWLDTLEPYLAQERRFFLNPIPDLERLMKDRDIDPLVIRIAERTIKPDLESKSASWAQMLDAVSAYQAQIRIYLRSMAGLWGEWNADADSSRIQFKTHAAKDVFTKESDALKDRANRLSDEIRALSAKGKER